MRNDLNSYYVNNKYINWLYRWLKLFKYFVDNVISYVQKNCKIEIKFKKIQKNLKRKSEERGMQFLNENMWQINKHILICMVCVCINFTKIYYAIEKNLKRRIFF